MIHSYLTWSHQSGGLLINQINPHPLSRCGAINCRKIPTMWLIFGSILNSIKSPALRTFNIWARKHHILYPKKASHCCQYWGKATQYCLKAYMQHLGWCCQTVDCASRFIGIMQHDLRKVDKGWIRLMDNNHMQQALIMLWSKSAKVIQVDKQITPLQRELRVSTVTKWRGKLRSYVSAIRVSIKVGKETKALLSRPVMVMASYQLPK
jgi:hypothetical protein